VRGMMPFGMTAEYVRVSVGVASENERLVETLRDFLR
jgi:histidinol-phosphate/aromatic aminotransferase/cobyric acid decarboxylase-like protein